jgi:ankyrin repeat protein
MNEQLDAIFARLKRTLEFSDADFSDVNAPSTEGDNALHWVVSRGDVSAAKALIGAGIDVNKAGDLGYTPLHLACMKGHAELAQLLIASGADVFALSEGDSPFTKARLSGHDNICDLLAPVMQDIQKRNPEVWARARIAQLKREIASLEKQIVR